MTARHDALLLTAPETFAMGLIEHDTAKGDTVAVRIRYTGLCGTDLHIISGQHPRATFPLAIGHELVGEVEDESGAERLVVVDPLISCGRCAACQSHRPHVCRALRIVGIDAPGGLAGRISVQRRRLHAVPLGVEASTATLAEPLAVAVHAERRSRVAPGSNVVIIGAGPIGLLLALLVRHRRAARIFLAESAPARRETAARFGFEVLDAHDPVADLADRTKGRLADLVYDAAATPKVAALLPHLVRAGGRIALVGVYGAPVTVDLTSIVFGEVTLVGNRVYAPRDIDAAIRLLASGQIDTDGLITGIVPVEETPEVIVRLRAGEGIKYLVDCRGLA